MDPFPSFVHPDPAVRYPLAAAAVLLAAVLVSGLTDRALRPARRPRAWLVTAVAALVAVTGGELAWRFAADAGTFTPFVRLPLLVTAMLLGPWLAATGTAIAVAGDPLARGDAHMAVAAILQAAFVGWLALAPDPGRRRLAAAIALLGGTLLTHLTWGLATAVAADPARGFAHLVASLQAQAPSWLLLAALLAAVPPPAWRAAQRFAGGARDRSELPPRLPSLERRAMPGRSRRLDPPRLPAEPARPLALRPQPHGPAGSSSSPGR